MKSLFTLIIASLAMLTASSQSVGIGTTTPAISAQLDVMSSTKGFLPPRMTYDQRNAIQTPIAGLVIWCSDCDELQVYNGTIWKNMNGHASVLPTLPNITICNQVWMIKNLDVSTYRNGEPIPQVADAAAWASLTTGAWCWYNNDSATYAATYGRLYNWYAVNDSRGLAPAGWHVPSDLEWTTLFDCLGGTSTAGGKMKEAGLSHWLENTGTTNSSGFTGLPGSYRWSDGGFQYVREIGRWWSSTENSLYSSFGIDLNMYSVSTGLGAYNKIVGHSVRCIKD